MNTLVALLSAGIALAGVAIASAQLSIARTNLAHSLFERRYAIYAAARKLIAEICRSAVATNDEIFTFIRATDDSVFVLDDTITSYLAEIRKNAFRLAYLKQIISASQPRNNFHEAVEEEAQLLTWFTEQFDVLVLKFKPFLHLSEKPWHSLWAK